MGVDRSKVASQSVKVRDFAGQASNADPHDLAPGGAVEQVNAVSLRPGELAVRQGMRRVRFEDDLR